eukprot:8464359-Pyramimonas_sp.AAC.1
MSVSPETSSTNRDIEIAGLIFGTSKTAVSPETSSEKWDVERAAMRHIFGVALGGLLGRVGGLLGRLEAILGRLGAILGYLGGL